MIGEYEHDEGIGHCWHQVSWQGKPTEVFRCCSCGDQFVDKEVAAELERQAEENVWENTGERA